jgi:hypothetical protein
MKKKIMLKKPSQSFTKQIIPIQLLCKIKGGNDGVIDEDMIGG